MKILLMETRSGNVCRPKFVVMPLCVEQVIGIPAMGAKFRQAIGMRINLVGVIYNEVRKGGYLNRR